jgi:hypothetical protein
MTPIEAAAAARELVTWLELLAAADSKPKSNAEVIYTAWAESKEIVTALAGHIDFIPVTA